MTSLGLVPAAPDAYAFDWALLQQLWSEWILTVFLMHSLRSYVPKGKVYLGGPNWALIYAPSSVDRAKIKDPVTRSNGEGGRAFI